MYSPEPVEETRFSFSADVPKAPDRRSEQRHLTILRVGTLVLDGRRELCLIRNISVGGLMARIYSDVEPGRRLAVELKTNHQIPGEVAWVDDPNIGIKFDDPIDLEEMLANPPTLDNGWRPRMPRVEIERLGTVRVGARVHWITARDISQGGIKIECDQPLTVNDEVVVTLDGFRPVHGLVRWSKDGNSGIAFNQVIPFKELMDWLKQQG